MKDVCFQVYETQRDLFRRWEEVRGCWWNIAMGEPFPIGNAAGLAIETIKIKDPENWSTYANVGSI